MHAPVSNTCPALVFLRLATLAQEIRTIFRLRHWNAKLSKCLLGIRHGNTLLYLDPGVRISTIPRSGEVDHASAIAQSWDKMS